MCPPSDSAALFAQENKELLIKRKARMKEFLAAEALTFEMQLNAQGKAFNVSEA